MVIAKFLVLLTLATCFLAAPAIQNNCTCVSFHQCAMGNSDGSGMIDVRIFQNSSCPGHFDVCCDVTKVISPLTIEKPLVKQFGCGYQNSGFFPWSAALLLKKREKESMSYKCGVSLINRKAVITAAHCLDDTGIWTIRIANMMRTVDKIIVHPSYSPATLHNDIAIIILDIPVPLSRKIGTICIPPSGSHLDHAKCNAAAWIKHYSNNRSFSYLKLIRLPIVPKDRCVKLLRSTRLGEMFQLHYSFLCAGGEENEDTCGGDGGSPLVCPVPGQPGRYHQVGVVSWGIGCGDTDVPGVYVKLSAFRDWIDEEMLRNHLEISSYRY